MKPLVSIITPAYNCADFITETIESVLSQDYPNVEYIVVDDGSKDNTREILTGFSNNIKLICQENAGEQLAVNRGLSEVMGDYFMIINADDPILPGCISELVKVMEENPDILCAYPDWQLIDERGNIIQHMKTPEYDFTFMVRHHWCLPSVGAIYRSSVIQNVGYRDNTFRYVGDFDYWLRVGLAGPMLRVPKELACWRRSDSQASNDVNELRPAERLVLMNKFYSLPDIPPHIMKVKGEAYSWACLVAAELSGTLKQRIIYTLKALRYRPIQLVTIGFWDAFVKYTMYYLKRTGRKNGH